jgi:rubrerythrin
MRNIKTFESMAGMWEDINTAMRLNAEGVKKSAKPSDDLRSYVDKEFKHMKRYKQFTNENKLYETIYECPHCGGNIYDDDIPMGGALVAGTDDIEDQVFDCPVCGDVVCGVDLTEC